MSLSRAVPKVLDDNPPTRAGYSEGCAWVLVRGAFSPNRIEARPGERLRIVFRREETAACSEQVVIPSLGKSVMLPPFKDVAVDLGPLPAGEHEFTCQLGVLRGRIVARRGAGTRSVETRRWRWPLSRMSGRGRTPTLSRARGMARRSWR